MHKKASALLFGGLVISRGRQKLVLVTKRALNRPCGTQTRGILGFSTHGRARDLPSLLSLFSTLILEFGLKATRTKDERQCACFFLCFFFSSFFFLSFIFLFFVPMSNGISKHQSDWRSSGPNVRGHIPTLTFSLIRDQPVISTNNTR